MCGVCGCGKEEQEPESKHAHKLAGDLDAASDRHEDHVHLPRFAHAPGLSARRMVQVEQDLFAQNQRYAQSNRQKFEDRKIFVLNLMSSPGSGKTTLLVRTVEVLSGSKAVAVIEGDQQTDRDAKRIAETGVPVHQINTGRGCHLDAHGVGHAYGHLAPADHSVLFIENVGNLVCPSGFDLGEARRVVILSVTEGEDKPLKYPDMFRVADVMVLNKIDLLSHVEFDVDACCAYARAINPSLAILMVSATRGAGMADWLEWLEAEQAQWVKGCARKITTG